MFCDNCGHALKPTAKFCAKCGTKIDEMPKKEKPSISQEDFIKKYYGDKIFDRISEILKSSEIGDEDRLFSIYEKLKKKKEVDEDEIQYLMDCSEELDYVKKYYGDKIEELDKKETELPANKKKISRVESTLLGDDPSSPLYTKGTSGFYGKRNVGKRKIMIAILGAVMFILIVGTIMLGNELGSETTPADITPTYQSPTLDTKKEFDPLIVASARENIPKMQEISKVVLKKCRDVNSYSDYQVFALAVAATDGAIVETIYGVAEVLMILELEGYDEHPEVGPLIKETRSLQLEASYCIDDLLMRYGN